MLLLQGLRTLRSWALRHYRTRRNCLKRLILLVVSANRKKSQRLSFFWQVRVQPSSQVNALVPTVALLCIEGGVMNETVFLGELAWPEAAKRMASGAPVFLPVGATEQHGHHMSLNVDVVIPTAIAERAARRVNGLVAPTIPYGNRSQPRSGGGRQFPGTLNLRAGTLSLVIRDVLVELFRQKARENCRLEWPLREHLADHRRH